MAIAPQAIATKIPIDAGIIRLRRLVTFCHFELEHLAMWPLGHIINGPNDGYGDSNILLKCCRFPCLVISRPLQTCCADAVRKLDRDHDGTPDKRERRGRTSTK